MGHRRRHQYAVIFLMAAPRVLGDGSVVDRQVANVVLKSEIERTTTSSAIPSGRHLGSSRQKSDPHMCL